MHYGITQVTPVAHLENSGNCNFKYVSGLMGYEGKPEYALFHILSTPPEYWSSKAYTPAPRTPDCGMILFARDSDTKRPYAQQLADLITAQKLGAIITMEAPNPMHSYGVGQLYVWRVEWAACTDWWRNNQHLKK